VYQHIGRSVHEDGGARVYTRQQLADMFGVKPSLIGKYRKMGILPPPVPPMGCTAAYRNEHVEIMRAIWGRDGLKDTNRTLGDFAEARAIAAEATR
jgi:hypothetical protein